MKIFKYILPAALVSASLVVSSCSDDLEDDITVVPTEVTSASLEEGSTVDVLLHKQFTLKYNHPIVISDANGVTLNGKPLQNVKADVCTLTADLALEPGTDYTLAIAPGAVTRYGDVGTDPEAYTLKFKTRALPVIDANLINPNATAEAKQVYAALMSVYGKKALSGTMGEIAWGSDYYDAITEAAGKAPAVIGFDYIHLASSPANWIDYGDITPVKEAWESGAVPAITWHWNVPRTNKKGAKLDYAVSKFMPSNVMIEGSWENGVAEADVKKLAGYLKLLQDAKIPVIFRPLHEAAGDYTNGAWFWWGAEGVDVTKDLWNWLYNKLTNEYGINNLIWEWTMQTNSSGVLASNEELAGAYVGNANCDMVGVDLYANDDLWSNFDCWYAVREAIDGKKMIALSECGKLFNPDVAFAKGETWLYFMQWYENISSAQYGIVNYSPAESWQSVMQSPYILDLAGWKTVLGK